VEDDDGVDAGASDEGRMDEVRKLVFGGFSGGKREGEGSIPWMVTS
jgi:hypothetical protein